MDTQTFTFSSSPFVPVAIGFFGLGTGYFIWGGQALFGFPKASPEVNRSLGLWGFWMPGFMQFLTGTYLLVGLTWFGVFQNTAPLYMAGLAFTVAVFPVLQANRIAMGLRGTGHSQAVEDIGATLERALAKQDVATSGPHRAETHRPRRCPDQHSVATLIEQLTRNPPVDFEDDPISLNSVALVTDGVLFGSFERMLCVQDRSPGSEQCILLRLSISHCELETERFEPLL